MTGSHYRLCPSCKKRGVQWRNAMYRACRFCGWSSTVDDETHLDPGPGERPSPLAPAGSGQEKGT